MLAWVRTGLAIIGLGFLIARFSLFLREAAAIRGEPGMTTHPGFSLWLGLIVILAGATINLAAARQHHHFLSELRRAGEPAGPRYPLSLFAAFASVAMALGVILTLFV